MEQRIEFQKNRLINGNPVLHLDSSCRLGNGIQELDEDSIKTYAHEFDHRDANITIAHFIPASGSGSRMFDSLFQFIIQPRPNEETLEFVEHFINCAGDFAFYNKLPQHFKDELNNGTLDIQEFIKLLLSENGFNFGNLPKGLIPFHRYGNFIVNPFQEHILQGVSISGERTHFHFTINSRFESRIHNSIKILKDITGIDFKHSFSEQHPATDAIAFNENLEPLRDERGDYITRPAGHGALLKNLNEVIADIVFIRNIDNIQHQTKATKSILTRKAMAGILLQIKKQIHGVLQKIEEKKSDDINETLNVLNEKFHLEIPKEKFNDAAFIFKFLNRPIRICGMVKNEGQPGGGPFWVLNQDGIRTRQIVEKSQISNDPSQLSLIVKSTHFNPVEIACSFVDYKGQVFNLAEYKNSELYFIVGKTHNGIPIQYAEEPGLWNGAMENWLTFFYEIDSACFSPVKTVLDLLKPLHQEK